jgi:hypothetical protein
MSSTPTTARSRGAEAEPAHAGQDSQGGIVVEATNAGDRRPGGSPGTHHLCGGRRVQRDGERRGLGQPQVGAGLPNALQAGPSEHPDALVVGQGVAEVAVAGRGEMLDLEPAEVLLTEAEVAAAPGAASERDDLDAGGAQGRGFLRREVLEGDHGRGRDRLPHVRDRARSVRAGMHHEHEPFGRQGRRRVLEQGADGRTDRPVREQAQHRIGAAGAQGAGGRGGVWDGKTSDGCGSVMLRLCSNSSRFWPRPSLPGRAHARTSCVV